MKNIFYKTFRRIAAAAGAASIILFGAIFYYTEAIPDKFYVTEGKNLSFSNLSLIKEAPATGYDTTSLVDIPTGGGKTVKLNLFGIIPIKTTHVNVVSRPVVTPGGTPFGIKLFTEGIMVVDIGKVETLNGVVSPAKSAGIQKGDIILLINGQNVTSNEQIGEIIEQSKGKTLSVNLQRNGENINTILTPAVSRTDGKYKSGIWVRDSSAGIGTITYYDASTGDFAGLGHGICDVDTGEIMPLQSGEVCDVTINNIVKGRVGSPGELCGSFSSNVPCGYLNLNNESGIFGELLRAPNKLSSVPIKLKQEVKTGRATILCTINNSGIQEFAVNIDKVDLNPDQLTKNMLITVVDPSLLEKTGGIVQGMSGSPILQNGQLVGAITHVFVNNPKKGYGIFAENMLNY